MGIRRFYELFECGRVLKIGDLFGKIVAIDASMEIYRACLGMSSTHALSRSDGQSTVHIGPLQATIMKLYQGNVGQIWIFDTSRSSLEEARKKGLVNNDKLQENLRRHQIRDNARERVEELKDFAHDMEVTDDFIELMKKHTVEETSQTQTQINRLEKQAFTPPSYVIEDLIIMLNTLGIPWIESPVGFQAEHLAAKLASAGIVDGVLSKDSDTLAFGSPILYARDKADVLCEYRLSAILESIGEDATIDDLRKISVILGCDWCRGTKGMRLDRILKIYRDVELTEEQSAGIEIFAKPLVITPYVELNLRPTITKDNVEVLINWLVNEQEFSRDRLEKLYVKYSDVAQVAPKRRKPVVRQQVTTKIRNEKETIKFSAYQAALAAKKR